MATTNLPATRLMFTKLAEYAGRVAGGDIEPKDAIAKAMKLASEIPGYKAEKFQRHATTERNMFGNWHYVLRSEYADAEQGGVIQETEASGSEAGVLFTAIQETVVACSRNVPTTLKLYKVNSVHEDSELVLDEFLELEAQGETSDPYRTFLVTPPSLA